MAAWCCCRKLSRNHVVLLISILTLLLPFASSVAFAVEVAPRISDREIIESLAELKTGQKALQQQINDLKESTQQQINDLKESTNQRFDSFQQQINDLQESMNKRFDILQWMLGLFITISLSLFGVIGKILWNQQKRLSVIEAALETQKDELLFLKQLIDRLLLARGVA